MASTTKTLRDIPPDARGMPWREWQLKYGHRLATAAEMAEEAAKQKKPEIIFGEKTNGKTRR